jgi:peptidyl-prolyl cis-trans isomerase A (cyclophilin A)
MSLLRLGLLSCALSAATPAAAQVTTTQVKFATTLGVINVTLSPGTTPITVANFLSYVNRGAYDHSFFHRSAADFVIQGGGFFIANDLFQAIPTTGNIQSEAHASNVRGTLAMALDSTGPGSANSQWFFNVDDNSADLDGPINSGPFTVFGQISDAASLAVMDSIASQRIVNLSASLQNNPNFAAVPVVNASGTNVGETNFIYVESIDALVAAGSPDYAISASPSALTLKSGAVGTSTLTVTPSNGYTGTITLGCGPLPTNVSCTFAPATLTFAAGATAAQTSTLTVNTKTETAMNGLPGGQPGHAGGFGKGFGSGAGLSAIAGFFGLACIAVFWPRTRRSLGYALVLALGFGAVVSACGGGSNNSNAFNVPIRLTDGTVSHPAGLTVTIQ